MPSAAVYTTVFPNALPFLAEFADSLEEQSDRDFDLFIGLDRLTREEVEQYFGRQITGWFDHRNDDTPGTLRSRAFQTISDSYDLVVLVDSDDTLHPQRVEAARRGLREADVYACSLSLVNEEGHQLGFRVAPPTGDLGWKEFLSQVNIFGLSNTAYRSELLMEAGRVDASTGIVDWYLVSLALALGGRLTFDRRELMTYRQYGKSTLETVPPYTMPGTMRAVELARDHYRSIIPVVDGHDKAFGALLRTRQRDVEQFAHVAEHRGIESYLQRLNEMTHRTDELWWWQQIAAPDLEELWRLD